MSKKTDREVPFTSPTEHYEQCVLMIEVRKHYKDYPELELLFAIPNGGKRHLGTAVKLKAEGVRAGIPDLFLPVARPPYHGLFIEMKRLPYRSAKTNKMIYPGPSTKQKAWIRQLKYQGYQAVVCQGASAALEVFLGYIRHEYELGDLVKARTGEDG